MHMRLLDTSTRTSKSTWLVASTDYRGFRLFFCLHPPHEVLLIGIASAAHIMLTDGNRDRTLSTRDPITRYACNAARCLSGRLPERGGALARRKSAFTRAELLSRRVVVAPDRGFQNIACVLSRRYLSAHGVVRQHEKDLELSCRRVPPYACRARRCHYLRSVLSRRRLCAHSVERQHGEDLELRHRRLPPYACRTRAFHHLCGQMWVEILCRNC